MMWSEMKALSVLISKPEEKSSTEDNNNNNNNQQELDSLYLNLPTTSLSKQQ